MMRIHNVVVLLTTLALAGQATSADTEVSFRGTLVETLPCILNNGTTLNISFGNQIGIKKVATGIYRQPVELGTLECESETGTEWQLMLSWTGSPAAFDADNATVVTAEQEALGIKLYMDSEPLKLNTRINLNGMKLPKLEAVLVHNEEIELTNGTFSAKGTLRAEYQ